MLPTALACLVLLADAVLLVAEHRQLARLKQLAKPIASTAFVACALSRGAAQDPYGQVLLVALAFSWLGDLLLLSRAKAIFLGGLGAFLLGHLAYAAAFLVRGVSWPVVAAAALLCAGALLPAGRWLHPHVRGRMRAPVAAYMLVISVMVALAAGAAMAQRAPLILLAASMFYVSDLAVARDRFVAPGFSNKLWGSPLYYGAQVLFCWTI